MKKAGKVHIVILCAIFVATGVMSYAWKVNTASGEGIEIFHMEKPTPTRLLMRLISVHTSKILDAIMIGNFKAVVKEADAIAENSKVIMDNFFPQGKQVGVWFKETGKDPNDPEAVKAMKEDFEKYLKTVIDAANNIAATATKKDIIETYKSFDAMMTDACFGCHEAFRPKWPEWPEWMKISGG
ncbi:MAG: cytochrome c [Candidatus Brocadiales bacterium]|jgi:cytochrome c556